MRLSKSMMGRSVVLWCMAGALQSHRKDTKVSWIRRLATSLTQSGRGYCHRLLRLLHSCRADSSNLPTNAIRMGITAPAPHRNSLRGRFLPRFREGARFLRVYERQSRGSAWLGERGGSCQLGSVLAYPKGRSDHRGGRARSRVGPHAHLPIRFRCPCPAIIKDFRGAAGETSQSDEIHTDHTRPWRGELARPFRGLLLRGWEWESKRTYRHLDRARCPILPPHPIRERLCTALRPNPPFALFHPTAFKFRPAHFPLILTVNITPSILPRLLEVCAAEGSKHGCEDVRVLGFDPKEDVGT